MGNTVPSLFAAIVGKDPSLPFLTFYDDATGERTELSGATLANWVSKTANLLVDGCGLGPGDTAAVRLPAHWQTAAILLGFYSTITPSLFTFSIASLNRFSYPPKAFFFFFISLFALPPPSSFSLFIA
ncbi:hypothetical protein GCM10020218_057690 [Dactylosporangium vinaceum]